VVADRALQPLSTRVRLTKGLVAIAAPAPRGKPERRHQPIPRSASMGMLRHPPPQRSAEPLVNARRIAFLRRILAIPDTKRTFISVNRGAWIDVNWPRANEAAKVRRRRQV
jgi:hypothetical protein